MSALGNAFDYAPVWVLVIAIETAMLIAFEVGYVVGHRGERETGQVPYELVLAAALTLVALLLGFTFSMGLERYDSRRDTIVREANAIGLAYERSDLLDPAAAGDVRARLRAYLATRLEMLRAVDPAQRAGADAKSAVQWHLMWEDGVAAAARHPTSNAIPLLLAALNEVSGVRVAERAVLDAYIPKSVVVMLVAISVLTMLMLGYRFGRNRRREAVAILLFAVILAVAIGIVLDLGAPQRGMISVSVEPLAQLQQFIAQ